MADALHQWVTKRFTPRIDPEHPLHVAASLGNVVLNGAVKLGERCGREFDFGIEFGEVLARVVAEGLGEQLLFRVVVIVDEAGRDREALGHIGYSGGGESAFDNHFACGLKDLFTPLFDRLLLH